MYIGGNVDQHCLNVSFRKLLPSQKQLKHCFISSNIPAAPAYGVYISQLIRYSRACGSYQDFLDRELLLTRKQLNQGFLVAKLKSSLRTFYARHHDLVDRYGISALSGPVLLHDL